MIKAITVSRLGRAGIRKAAALAAFAMVVAAGPAVAQTPGGPDDPMKNLPGLSQQGGAFTCPDGTTRTYKGEPPSDLFKSMKCSGPADGAGPSPAQQAMAAKNAEASQAAALAGQAGVKAGLEATARTGRPDYLLHFPWVWAIGLVAAFAAIGVVLSRVLGRGK